MHRAEISYLRSVIAQSVYRFFIYEVECFIFSYRNYRCMFRLILRDSRRHRVVFISAERYETVDVYPLLHRVGKL